MAMWLFKEEPDHYSFENLRRDGRTEWDGVGNNLARKYLRQVRSGDRVLYYHTGKEKAVVGEMRAVAEAVGEAPVIVEYVAALPNPVTLARIKQQVALSDWELVRLPRLSVVPVTAEQWRAVEAMSRQEA